MSMRPRHFTIPWLRTPSTSGLLQLARLLRTILRQYAGPLRHTCAGLPAPTPDAGITRRWPGTGGAGRVPHRGRRRPVPPHCGFTSHPQRVRRGALQYALAMNPVEVNKAFAACRSRIDTMEARLDEITAAMRTILDRTAHLAVAPAPPAVPVAAPTAPVPASEPPEVQAAPAPPAAPLRLPAPPRFDGSPEACRGFVNQCRVHFELSPGSFLSERAKVGFMVSLLTDRALAWASPLWEEDSPLVGDSATFIKALRQVFDKPGRKATAGKSLLSIRQGARSLGDYAIEFRTIAAELRWNNEALVAAFSNGLSDRLKDEIATRDLPEDLEGLIAFVAKIDARLRERSGLKQPSRREVVRPPVKLSSSDRPVDLGEPMELGFTQLSGEERARRRQNGLCLYCGLQGHLLRQCPTRPGNART